MNLRMELFVENMERTIEFYSDILNFEVLGEVNHTYTSIRNGSVQIGLGKMENLPDNHPLKVNDRNQQKGLGIEIVIGVDDVHQTYQKVLETGYPIKSEMAERPWGLEDFRLIDPDGYYIRITS
ncbi:VOC family protein [Virgibacillus kekensis]|uniref:VOC family protein n=1 Tax=Virgibacillus kekensis TaxID=202261 RepID=A0ABV9DQ13_9BACI